MRPFKEVMTFKHDNVELHIKQEDCGHALGFALKKIGSEVNWGGVVLTEEEINELTEYLINRRQANAA